MLCIQVLCYFSSLSRCSWYFYIISCLSPANTPGRYSNFGFLWHCYARSRTSLFVDIHLYLSWVNASERSYQVIWHCMFNFTRNPPAYFLKNTLLNYLGSSEKIKVCMFSSISGLYVLLHWEVYLSLHPYNTLLIIVAFRFLKLVSVTLPTLFLSSRIVFRDPF